MCLPSKLLGMFSFVPGSRVYTCVYLLVVWLTGVIGEMIPSYPPCFSSSGVAPGQSTCSLWRYSAPSFLFPRPRYRVTPRR